MKGKRRAFGPVLAAVLAIGAIGAQAASAVVEHSFRSAAQNTVLTGQNWSSHVFDLAGINGGCSMATFEGTNVGTIRDTATMHPQYSSCEFFGQPATVDTNGCNYIFDSDTTASTHSSSSEHAAMSIECETGHHILLTMVGCKVTISAVHNSAPVNQSLHGVTFGQISSHGFGKDALTVTATVKTVHFTALTGSFCQLVGLPPGTYTSGAITGITTVTGFEDGEVDEGNTTTGRFWAHGNQVDITVSTPT